MVSSASGDSGKSVMDTVEVFTCFRHTDSRGYLLKAVKKEYTDDRPFGEIYIVGAPKGEIRANHYHLVATEWFVILAGEAELTLADYENTEDRRVVPMGGENRVCVKIPPGVAHAIQNVGEEDMILMALADKPYDPNDTDTYALTLVS